MALLATPASPGTDGSVCAQGDVLAASSCAGAGERDLSQTPALARRCTASRPPSRNTATAPVGPWPSHRGLERQHPGAVRLPPALSEGETAHARPLWEGSGAGLCAALPRRGETRSGVLFSRTMQALKAHVLNGQIVVDEPTNLPEGCELRLVAVDADELDDEDRRALHAAFDEAADEIDRGEVVDEATVWATLRALR